MLKTTSTNSITLLNLPSCSQFNMYVSAYDAAGNESLKILLQVATVLHPEEKSFNDDWSQAGALEFKAEKIIYLIPGFRYKAANVSESLRVAIEACNNPSVGRASVSTNSIIAYTATKDQHDAYNKVENSTISVFPNPFKEDILLLQE
jgi:hypothetical protein